MIHPISARLPLPEAVQTVVAPPYDALRPEERFTFAQAHPDNFLTVILSPEDMPDPDLDPDELGRRSRAQLARLLENYFTPPAPPAFYVYEMSDHGHCQRGVVASIRPSDAGRILGHERVLDRRVAALARFYAETGINPSPISVMWRPDASAGEATAAAATGPPVVEYIGHDGIAHRVWRVADAELPVPIQEMDRLYISDGHHRMAAAMAGEPEIDILIVAFPAAEMQVFGYHRVVNAQAPVDFFDRIGPTWRVSPSDRDIRAAPGVVGLCMGGRWYRLERVGDRPLDQVDRLDVSLVHQEIIQTGLGVYDEHRIDYRVDSDPVTMLERETSRLAIGFLLEPPTIEDIMAVADAGRWLPPKSTWFAPKVRSGLLVVEH